MIHADLTAFSRALGLTPRTVVGNDWLSVRELCETLGIDNGEGYKHVKRAVQDGKLEAVRGMKIVDGRKVRAMYYRPKEVS